MSRIALDAVWTVRPAPAVAEAMLPWLSERHALPGSPGPAGREATRALEQAREQVGLLLGVETESVVFTSGAVEANNTALRGAARLARRDGRRRLAVPVHEVPSLLHPARTLAREGFALEAIPVGRDGLLRSQALPEAPLGVVALSLAHPELGAMQPVAEIAAAGRAAGALVVVDVSLAAGRVACDRETLGRPDVVTLDFHRMGGPLGAGALAVPDDVPLPPLLEGGAEERGFRPGSPDLPAIVGAGAAAEAARAGLREREARLRSLGRELARAVLALPGVRRTGPDESARLPGHLSVVVQGVDADALLFALETRGVLASTGSACADAAGLPSAALLACGYSREEIRSAVLFCIPPVGEPAAADILRAASAFAAEVERLRRIAGPMAGPGA